MKNTQEKDEFSNPVKLKTAVSYLITGNIRGKIGFTQFFSKCGIPFLL